MRVSLVGGLRNGVCVERCVSCALAVVVVERDAQARQADTELLLLLMRERHTTAAVVVYARDAQQQLLLLCVAAVVQRDTQARQADTEFPSAFSE